MSHEFLMSIRGMITCLLCSMTNKLTNINNSNKLINTIEWHRFESMRLVRAMVRFRFFQYGEIILYDLKLVTSHQIYGFCDL